MKLRERRLTLRNAIQQNPNLGEARLIQLERHVVMDALFDGAWHLYDSDAEVGPADLYEALPNVNELIADAAQLSALYEPNNPQMIPVILSTQDNWIGDQEQNRVRLETFGSIAKYATPLAMIMIALFLLRRNAR